MQPDETSRLEDLTFMADMGETLQGAANRLGITDDAVEKWLRHRDPQLTKRLVRNATWAEIGHGARAGKLTVTR